MMESTPRELLVVYKGFRDLTETAPYREVLGAIQHRYTLVEDVGFDLGAYFEVYRRFRYPFYLFIGSFCTLRAPEWLAIYMRAVSQQRAAGIVTASGSFASGITPNFPNVHARTAAFLMADHALADIRVDPIITKYDAYEVEHGLHSLTQQIEARGLMPYVVGRDGRAFAPEDWPASHTFWSGDQENLLISDNRTAMYDDADIETRRVLAEGAWGIYPPVDVRRSTVLR
jgi:hypothetical protein